MSEHDPKACAKEKAAARREVEKLKALMRDVIHAFEDGALNDSAWRADVVRKAKRVSGHKERAEGTDE